MSLTLDRHAFAAALDAVDGISGYDDEAPMSNVGDAWARWAGYDDQGASLLFTTTWKIFVITGGTPSDAMHFLDSHLDALLAAIEHLAYVTTVRPIQFDPSALYGVEITATKES
jgi:hypothetical protein